jgi:hypothetical protein
MFFDYFIADSVNTPIRLEIENAAGETLNTFVSDKWDVTDTIGNMDLSSTTYLLDQSLSKSMGYHRFKWDMRHLGPWDVRDRRTYKNGPQVASGDYRVKLTVGEIVSIQDFTLLTDPRSLSLGVTEAEIQQQEALGLELVKLLTEVRKYIYGLEQEKKSAERTASASASESTIPPGPPPLPAPFIPQRKVWAAEEEARAFPYSQRPSAHTTPVDPPPLRRVNRRKSPLRLLHLGTPLATPSKPLATPLPHCPHLRPSPHCGECFHEVRCRPTLQLRLNGGFCWLLTRVVDMVQLLLMTLQLASLWGARCVYAQECCHALGLSKQRAEVAA